MRLTKLGKIVFTILLVVVSIIIYVNLGRIGEITSARNWQEFLGILGWCWLFTQPFILSIIWE